MRVVRTWFALPVALLAAIIAACAGGPPAGSEVAQASIDPGRPQVVIQSPPANATVAAGLGVDVVTTAVDAVGVGRIDLRVNDLTVSSAEAPAGGLTSFSAVHLWLPSAPGQVTLSAVAYRVDGAPSDPMSIGLVVVAAGASVPPYPTFAGAVPTYRASAVAGGYVQPTYKAGATYATPTGAATYGATPTYAAEATPTYAAGATPTYAAATPTYAATATATTAPTSPVAPPDADYEFTIPYNGANEISDYVSYPAGDVEDKVEYEVSGMNPSTQNVAKLVMFATCEGLGTQYVTFQIGTAKFGCGDKIIDTLITYDSGRIGPRPIRIYAFAGAYVKWTLNASAFAP